MPTVPAMPGPSRVCFSRCDGQALPHVPVRRERMECPCGPTPVACRMPQGFSPVHCTGSGRGCWSSGTTSWRHGMTMVARHAPRMLTVEGPDNLLSAQRADGRTMRVPLAWSSRLANATPMQRQHCAIIGTGQGVHRPDSEEDLRACGRRTGTPAPAPQQAVAQEAATVCITRSAARQGASNNRADTGRARAGALSLCCI